MWRPGGASQERTGPQRSGPGLEPHRRCCKAGEGEPLSPGGCCCRGHVCPSVKPQPAARLPSPHPRTASSEFFLSAWRRWGGPRGGLGPAPKRPGHSSDGWGRTQEEGSARGSCLSLANGELRRQGRSKAVPEQGGEGLGAHCERPWRRARGLSAGLWVTGRGVSLRSHPSGGAGCPQKK